MRSAVMFLVGLLGFGLLAAGSAAEPKTAPSPVSLQAAEFFESRVRPVLVEQCQSCHGAKKQMAGLRLDSRAALLEGSDNGPVVVPGDPEKSSLLQAIRHTGKVKMPPAPKKKLAPEAIEVLSAWVKMGVPWPETRAVDVARTGPKSVAEVRKTHWAFQPVLKPPLPAVKNPAWVTSPVDAFILARLEEKGMTPTKPADRRTLLRRASFDLTGLPPTPAEVAAFEADPAPDAFARVIDRLLASPRYGERWGRHWLDVARYADTKGYVFLEERRYPYSYTYRDYVIRAFNEDLPYNQFVLQQLAADQLLLGDDRRPLAAMGFLTLGRRFLNNTHDIIDDRIDVVTRGLQGLTVSCARCHDHKFDPIPTKDYYSLYGVFAGSVEPKDPPLLGASEKTPAYLAYEKELDQRQQQVTEFLTAQHAEGTARFRARAADYLLAVQDARRLPGEDHYEALTPGDLHPLMVRRWEAFVSETRKKHHPVLAPWHAFAAVAQKDFEAKAPAVAARVAANSDAQRPINPLVAKAFAEKAPASLREVAQRYGELFTEVERLWQERQRQGDKETGEGTTSGKAPAPAALSDPAQEALRRVLYAPGAPPQVPFDEMPRFLDRKARDQLTKLQRHLDQWKASPAAPPRAMVLQDAPAPPTPRVLLRGNPNNPGDIVPRQYLLVLAGDDRKPFQQGSGRLELARAIAGNDNPLTARVMVNRIWLHHFGAGLVRTPSEFGLRGEAPTHPELLDYLASTFMESGWSIKKVHRLIMLSNVYQQTSDGNLRYEQADPENRWLSKMNRRRLDFEAMRDGLLAVSGSLDTTLGGPAVDLTTAPFTTRRTVYGFIDRQNLPGLFRTFDFASPDATTSQRYTTTVPQQALFLLNSPFVVEQARRLLSREDVKAHQRDEQRIEHLYRLLYGRAADGEETALGVRFLKAAEAEGQEKPAPARALTAWEKYAQVLLLSNEFAFVD